MYVKPNIMTVTRFKPNIIEKIAPKMREAGFET